MALFVFARSGARQAAAELGNRKTTVRPQTGGSFESFGEFQSFAAQVFENRPGHGRGTGFSNHCAVRIFGQYAPSKRINVGAIGVGRISRGHDMPGILQYDNARIIAVCDLDAHRVEDGKKFVNDFYVKKDGKAV